MNVLTNSTKVKISDVGLTAQRNDVIGETFAKDFGTPSPQLKLHEAHAGPPSRALHGLSKTSGSDGVGVSEYISNSRMISGDGGTPPELYTLGTEGVEPRDPEVDALRGLITEIRAGSPALTAHRRLLPLLEYLLSLLVSQIHAAELESAARIPTSPPANIQPASLGSEDRDRYAQSTAAETITTQIMKSSMYVPIIDTPNVTQPKGGHWVPPLLNSAEGHLRAQGIGRDPQNDRVVFLSLNRSPKDDELRAIHDAIRRTPATCPFCSKPTYVLPCSHCGEPDVPDNDF
jgi:hypothetical protein